MPPKENKNIRKSIKLAVIGNLRSGKTTSTGHLVSKFSGIDESVIENLVLQSRNMKNGKEWVLNQLKALRNKKNSIDENIFEFETPKYDVLIHDTKGHLDFVRNTITGICAADCAVLIVSASKDEFEFGMKHDGETRVQALLAKSLGIRQVICAVNKMDTTEPAYSQARFNEISKEVSVFLDKIGYDSSVTPFVPISALSGDNMVEPSINLPWYEGWRVETKDGIVCGKTLLDAIGLVSPPDHLALANLPLRIPLRELRKRDGVTVLVGRVEAGILRPGTNVTLAPSPTKAQVKWVEVNRERVEEALPGDVVHFNVGDVPDGVERGTVVSDANDQNAAPAENFTAQLTVFNLGEEKITLGNFPVLDVHLAHVKCEIVELQTVDLRTGKVVEKNPKVLKVGETALAQLRPTVPLCVETFKEFPALGRFSIRDGTQVVAVGRIKSVQKKAGVSKDKRKRINQPKQLKHKKE